MSGGRFDYLQYRLRDVAEDVEKEIEKNGSKKTKEELKSETWHGPDWYEKYPEDLYHHRYSEQVIERFRRGAIYIRLAEIYIQRIDWLLSGDDGEESFLRRLEDDLRSLEPFTKRILQEQEDC